MEQNQYQQENFNEQQNQEIIENDQQNGPKLVSIGVASLVIILLLAGTAYAYKEFVNPFFLESKESVFEKMISNTYNLHSSQSYILNSVTSVNFDSEDASIPSYEFEIPASMKVENLGDSINSEVNIAFDVSPLISAFTQSLLSLGVADNLSTENQSEKSEISLSIKTIDDSLFARIEKFPEILSSIPFISSVGQLEKEWIEVERQYIEDSIDVQDEDIDKIMKNKDYIISRISEVFLNESMPQISTERTNEGNLRIDYMVDIKNLANAFYEAWPDTANGTAYNNQSFNKDEFEEAIEIIDGFLELELIINKDFALESYIFDLQYNVIDPDNPDVSLNVYGTGDYILDTEVVIEAPENPISFEEAMAMIYSGMFMISPSMITAPDSFESNNPDLNTLPMF